MKLGEDFDGFVRRSSGSLLRTGYLLVGDRGHAEDLLQDALLRTARNWRTARAAPEAYARRVVVNLTRDRWRALKRRPAEDLTACSDQGAAVADPATAWADRHVIAASIWLLPEQQRAVVVLRLWDEMSVKETAELLGISEGTVKSYTSRAVARLRELLSTSIGEGS